MEKNDPLVAAIPAPTASRPLLGLTVLVIEDSRFACDALRLLCIRSGARIRRADSVRSARRHLRVYRPSVVIADLGLPDGSGADLIRELTGTDPRVDVVIGTSGDLNGEVEAMKAGADAFIPKPITSLAVFQQIVLDNLPLERRPSGLRKVSDEVITPDRMAFHDDMAHIADVLTETEDETVLDYAVQFLGGVARSVEDKKLEQAADDLARVRAQGGSGSKEKASLTGLVKQRLAQKMAI